VRLLSVRTPTNHSGTTRPAAKKEFVASIVVPLQKQEVKAKKQVERACARAPPIVIESARVRWMVDGKKRCALCALTTIEMTRLTSTMTFCHKRSGLLPAVALQETALDDLIAHHAQHHVAVGRVSSVPYLAMLAFFQLLI
jgi:hypothetical protein